MKWNEMYTYIKDDNTFCSKLVVIVQFDIIFSSFPLLFIFFYFNLVHLNCCTHTHTRANTDVCIETQNERWAPRYSFDMNASQCAESTREYHLIFILSVSNTYKTGESKRWIKTMLQWIGTDFNLIFIALNKMPEHMHTASILPETGENNGVCLAVERGAIDIGTWENEFNA